jgi:hypothetical protein
VPGCPDLILCSSLSTERATFWQVVAAAIHIEVLSIAPPSAPICVADALTVPSQAGRGLGFAEPANGFEDRVSDVRPRLRTSAKDWNTPL